MAKSKKKEFWDVEEEIGFEHIKACDGLYYKVWHSGQAETKQKVANILARVRYNLNVLLLYLLRNPDKWVNQDITWGIKHTFDIHIPSWKENITQLQSTSDPVSMVVNGDININKLFNYQEMTPNEHGILGLNKPKLLRKITIPGKKSKYEIATKRSIFLTIRDKNGNIKDFTNIMKLAIHEITHTTCNDTRWKPDNHKYPYEKYHSKMKEWAAECKIL